MANRQDERPTTTEHGKAIPVLVDAALAVHDGTVELQVQVNNLSKHDVLVMNKLWTLQNYAYMVPDAEAVYRFQSDARLILLFGPAPLPRLQTVYYRNVPFGTVVKARQQQCWQTIMRAPISEYSVYFPPPGEDDLEVVRAMSARVIVDVIELLPELHLVPSPFGVKAWGLETLSDLEHLQHVCSRDVPIGIDCWRRTDEFDRFDPVDEGLVA